MAPGDPFLFVNVGGTDALDHKASTTARAFLMRKSRAQKHWTTRKGQKSAGSSQPATTGRDDTLIRKHNGRGARRAWEVDLQEEMAIYRPKTKLDGLFDPFGTAAVNLDKKDAVLLDFFAGAIFPEIFPISRSKQAGGARQSWLATSFKDPASLHGVLCLAALQMTDISATLPPMESVALALQHRSETIAAVQKNLADPQKAISDANIAAVFSLLCLEENLIAPAFSSLTGLQPDVSQLITHKRGLKEMIRLRGGVVGLSSSKFLQSMIIRYSVTRAGSSFDKTHLPPKSLVSQLHGGYPMSSKYFSETTPMTKQCIELGIDGTLIDLIKAIECLARDSRDWDRAPSTHRFDVLDIQGIWVMLSGQVLQRYLDMEDDGTLTPMDGIMSLCILLFVGLVVRARVIAFGGGTALIPRLSRCLADTTGNAIDSLRRVNLDVWVGVVTALSPSVLPEYEDQMWHIYSGAIARQNPPFHTAADLQRHLMEHSLWWPERLDRLAQIIWEQTPDVLRQPGTNKIIENPGTFIPSLSGLSARRDVAARNPYLCGAHIDKYLGRGDEALCDDS